MIKYKTPSKSHYSLSGLKVNRCGYHPAAYMAGQTTKESMERVKEEADNANEARYLHYGAYVVELETAKVMEELSDPTEATL